MGTATDSLIFGNQETLPNQGVIRQGGDLGEKTRALIDPSYQVPIEEEEIQTYKGQPSVFVTDPFNPDKMKKARSESFFAKKPPSFATLFKTAFADDPGTKIKIFAMSRFPDEPIETSIQRYGLSPKGEILFKDKDGIIKTETPDTFLSNVKRIAAETGGNSPAIIMGTIGAISGPAPAVIGAAGGEGVRKLIANLVFDEPQSSLNNALDISLEGLLGAVGEGAGKIFAGSTNTILGAGKPSGRKLAKLAKRDIQMMTPKELKARNVGDLGFINPLENPEEMKRLTALSKKYEIELSIPEIADSRELLNRFNLLGDLDQSADLIQQFKKTQNLQIQNAVPGFLDDLAIEDDPFNVGSKIKNASEKAIKGLKGNRARLAKPFYDKAFADPDIVVDIDPVIKLIDEKLVTSKGKIRSELIKAKNILLKPDLPRDILEIVDEGAGYVVTPVKGTERTFKINIFDRNRISALKSKLEEVELGDAGKRLPKEDGSGEYFGVQSTFPDFMHNLYDRKETVRAITKAIDGDNLGIREAEIVQSALEEIANQEEAMAIFGGGTIDIPAKPKELSKGLFETSTQSLHSAKMEFDRIIETAKQDSLGNTIKKNYTDIQKTLLDQMDTANPSYAQARLMHRIASPVIEKAEKGTIGRMAKLEGDNLAGAATQLLASKNTTPATVARAKSLINAQDPGVWNSALRDFLRFRFERLKDSQVSDISNIGGAFRKAVFGNENQRAILKSALSKEQFDNLSDFMTVLQRTGLTFAKESTTATRQEALKSLQRETQLEVLTIATSPFRTPERTIADRVNALRFGRGSRQLAELLLDPEAGKQLKAIKTLSPKSEKAIKMLSTFLSLEIGAIKSEIGNESE